MSTLDAEELRDISKRFEEVFFVRHSAERLKALRTLAGISVYEVDVLAGLSPGYAWRIEKNNPRLQWETTMRLAKLFGCSRGVLDGLTRATIPSPERVRAAVARARARHKRSCLGRAKGGRCGA